MAGVLEQVLELPDTPVLDAASLASTDELLSQLAGNEIDRILSEADAEIAQPNPATEMPAVTAPPQPASPQSPSINAQLDALFTELQDPIAVPAKEPATLQAEPSASAPTEALAAESEERNAVLEAAGFQSDAPGEVSQTPQTPFDSIVEPETPEKGALLAAAGFDANPANMDLPPMDMYIDRRQPLILKPLIWINAPFANCSATLRKVLGAFGIITFINAVGLIAYLLITHKHH